MPIDPYASRELAGAVANVIRVAMEDLTIERIEARAAWWVMRGDANMGAIV